MEGMQDMEGMHSMEGMSSISPTPATVPASDIEGDYVGVIRFASAGHWTLNTHFSINGQTLNADFPVDVASGPSSFALTVLAAFAGLNAFIIWAASFTKRTPVTA